jgi:hypothetical protein
MPSYMPTCRKGKGGSVKGSNTDGSSKKGSSKKSKKSSKDTECHSSSDDGDEVEEEDSATVAAHLSNANLSSSAGCGSVGTSSTLAAMSFFVTVFFAY